MCGCLSVLDGIGWDEIGWDGLGKSGISIQTYPIQSSFCESPLPKVLKGNSCCH